MKRREPDLALSDDLEGQDGEKGGRPCVYHYG